MGDIGPGCEHRMGALRLVGVIGLGLGLGLGLGVGVGVGPVRIRVGASANCTWLTKTTPLPVAVRLACFQSVSLPQKLKMATSRPPLGQLLSKRGG